MSKNKKYNLSTRTFADVETGEEFQASTIIQEATDRDFEKIWLAHILTSLDELGNKKIQILSYLFRKRSKSDNVVTKTLREIAKETGISYPTVQETIQTLLRNGLIKKKTGVIFLSPAMIYKGTHDNRMRVMFEYREVKTQKEDTPEQTPKQLQPAPAEIEMNTKPLEVTKKKVKIKTAKGGV
jgi:DNA-binding Lrp family transcriptional regulator